VSSVFIKLSEKKSTTYAEIFRPKRSEGKKVNDPEYLGKVIDLDKGIFYSRKRGYFKYTIESGYEDADGDYSNYRSEEKLILDFGNAYVLSEFLKQEGYWALFVGILGKRADSVLALLMYRLLEHTSNCLASTWLSGSYASVLLPKAQLASQRNTELLGQLGNEVVQREFFRRYLSWIVPKGEKAGILIDSTGMPNTMDSYLTAASNHNGDVNVESRLLLVVDRHTSMPLFFRYNAGNIVDVSALRATIDELSALGVSVDFAILDAGYYSDQNADALFDAAIPFLTRLQSNRKLYKLLLAEHALESADNNHIVDYQGRLVGIKRVACDLHEHRGYAYVCVDIDRRDTERREYMREAIKKNVPRDEWETLGHGVFILVSSEAIESDQLLSVFYMRQKVEQVFDIQKNNVDLLPLRTHTEETLRGHLFLTFLTTVAYMALSRRLNETKMTVDSAMLTLRNLKCKIFDDFILVKEATKQMKEAAAAFDVKNFPSRI
jgi:hypothetical protein